MTSSTSHFQPSPELQACALDGQAAPNPPYTWRDRLRAAWQLSNGCVCATMATQGSLHTLCFVFAGVSGAGAGGFSRLTSSLFNGNGLIGLTGAETLQFIVAPALSIPASYLVDKWRHAHYSAAKLAVAFFVSAGVTVGLAYSFPHKHDASTAMQWFETQPPSTQQALKDIAITTNRRLDDVALDMCGKMQKPHERIADYFKRSLNRE